MLFKFLDHEKNQWLFHANAKVRVMGVFSWLYVILYSKKEGSKKVNDWETASTS